jgi:hypothetical protein
LFYKVEYVFINLNYRTYITQHLSESCILWNVKLKYIMTGRGYMKFEIGSEFKSCYDFIVIDILDDYSNITEISNIILIMICIIQSFIIFKRFYYSYKLLNKVKEKLINVNKYLKSQLMRMRVMNYIYQIISGNL